MSLRKTIIGLTAIAAFALPTAAMAAPNANPANNSCFGQGRAWAATNGFTGGGVGWDPTSPGVSEMGKAISERAGTNPTVNQKWIAANCA
jgi:hypothetical protein